MLQCKAFGGIFIVPVRKFFQDYWVWNKTSLHTNPSSPSLLSFHFSHLFPTHPHPLLREGSPCMGHKQSLSLQCGKTKTMQVLTILLEKFCQLRRRKFKDLWICLRRSTVLMSCHWLTEIYSHGREKIQFGFPIMGTQVL